MILTGREEALCRRGREREQLIFYSTTKRVCVCVCLGNIFLTASLLCLVHIVSDCNSYVNGMCIHVVTLMCVHVACMCTAVLFHGLAGECCKRMIRLGAHQGCSAIT